MIRQRTRRQAGFTLLEVMVATLIMAIAVVTLLSGLAASTRNAAKLAAYDRSTTLAKQKMDELLLDLRIPRNQTIEGPWADARQPGGWRARVSIFDPPGGVGAPGSTVLDRIELEVWWMDGATRKSFTLEGFRTARL
jgi:prepilin-type N-terminal cleavage/methylation domain-containing protein